MDIEKNPPINGFDIKITVKIEEVPATILDFFPSDRPARNRGKAEKLAKITPGSDPYWPLTYAAPLISPANKPKPKFLSISPYLRSLKEEKINHLNTEAEPET